MKAHSSLLKENIKAYGREFDTIITYTENNEEIELGNEDITSVSPHYEGDILKSVMRQLDIECYYEIPIGTTVHLNFGVKVETYDLTQDAEYLDDKEYYLYNDEYEQYVLLLAGEDYEIGDPITEDVYEYNEEYEYLDFGNYIVKETEKKEDTNSYQMTCYDKMLNTMVDYEAMEIEYPISIRSYIGAICSHLNLTFANASDEFANYDKMIQNELYLSEEGESIGYSFRDVLDDLAQVTASTICINETTDALEIRYINDTNDTIDAEYLKDANVNFNEKYGPINSIVLSRSAESDNVFLQDSESIDENGLCELKIVDNQIMNWNDRSDYLLDIFEVLNGLQYYLNDFASTGVCYYNLCDKYNISITKTDESGDIEDDEFIGEETTNVYPCIMLNDDITINQGLEENIHTQMPTIGETDYSYASDTDKKINKAYIIVKKNESEIEALTSEVTDTNETIEQVVQNIEGLTNNFTKTGGTNLFYNTGLHFRDSDDKFTYWTVNPIDAETDYLNVVNDSESLSGTNMVLPRGKVSQTITLAPGDYSYNFQYKQNIATAVAYVTINGVRTQLDTKSDWTEIDLDDQYLNIIGNTLTIEFECNIQGGYYIKELMLNRGETTMEYSQNINETRTDTVQISNGILVSSSTTNTVSRHDSDGFRILRKDNQEVVLRATENGTETTSIKASGDSEVAGLIIKRYNGHTLLSSKGVN